MNDACIPDKELSVYLDQALSGTRSRRVSGHLNACAVCRRRLAALQQADDVIRSLPSITPSAGFDAGFWEKVARLEERKERPAWLQALLGGWRPVLVSAAAAVLLVAILLFHEKADTRPTMEEMFMVENMEMLDDLQLIQQLDMLEHWDDIRSMEEQG